MKCNSCSLLVSGTTMVGQRDNTALGLL